LTYFLGSSFQIFVLAVPLNKSAFNFVLIGTDTCDSLIIVCIPCHIFILASLYLLFSHHQHCSIIAGSIFREHSHVCNELGQRGLTPLYCTRNIVATCFFSSCNMNYYSNTGMGQERLRRARAGAPPRLVVDGGRIENEKETSTRDPDVRSPQRKSLLL
jgi:hypothetical protein